MEEERWEDEYLLRPKERAPAGSGGTRRLRTGCRVRKSFSGFPPTSVEWCIDHRVQLIHVDGHDYCLGAAALQPSPRAADLLSDHGFPASEQLPRCFRVRIIDIGGRPYRRTRLEIDGMATGDVVDDNALVEDEYRHHDLFHLSNVAVLGWSPVMRSLLERKRRSISEIDRVEDGARSQDIEEAVITGVFLDLMAQFPDYNSRLLSPAAIEQFRFDTRMLEVASVSNDDLQRVATVGLYAMLTMRTSQIRAFEVDMLQRTVAPLGGLGPTQLSLPLAP